MQQKMTQKMNCFKFFWGRRGWLKIKLFFSIEITILEATNDMYI